MNIIPITIEEATRRARLFEALAHPTRLRILGLLSKREGELDETELAQHFEEEERPSLPEHLSLLYTVGVIQVHEKWGGRFPFVDYSVLNKALDYCYLLI